MPAAQRIEFQYKPQGMTLYHFHRASEFIRVLIGPLGSGKTQACISDILLRIDTQAPDSDGVRRSRWVAARNTFRDLNTTTIKDWKALTSDRGFGDFKNGAPPIWSCDYQRDDSTRVRAEVLFEAFDLASDDKKARGKQLTGVWFNELKELHKGNVDMLMSRVTRYPPRAEVPDAKYHIIGDSNAPDRDHWLARLALEEQPEGWWFGIQPGGVVNKGGQWVMNPQGENVQNLTPTYYTAQLGGKKESWIRQNLANEFVFHADGRPVHPDFSEQLHVTDVRPSAGIQLHVGVDFGRTPAAAIMQRQHDGRWFILHELCTVNTSAKRFGEILAEFLNEHYPTYDVRITGDPAGDDMSQTRDETPIQMLQLAGLEASPAHTNDFEVRTSALDTLLTRIVEGTPSVLIHPDCTTLIRGLAGAYQFRRVLVSGADRYHDKPDKGPESHICEAVHYGLMGGGVTQNLFQNHWEAKMGKETWTMPKRYGE